MAQKEERFYWRCLKSLVSAPQSLSHVVEIQLDHTMKGTDYLGKRTIVSLLDLTVVLGALDAIPQKETEPHVTPRSKGGNSRSNTPTRQARVLCPPILPNGTPIIKLCAHGNQTSAQLMWMFIYDACIELQTDYNRGRIDPAHALQTTCSTRRSGRGRTG